MTEPKLREFYELCQTYRSMNVLAIQEVRDAYEALVEFVDNAVADERRLWLNMTTEQFKVSKMSK